MNIPKIYTQCLRNVPRPTSVLLLLDKLVKVTHAGRVGRGVDLKLKSEAVGLAATGQFPTSGG